MNEPIRPTVGELETNLDKAIEARLAFEYRHGLEDGLAVALKIRNWLTRQPDRAWQKQTREWADKEIEKVMRISDIKSNIK
jgi:hypothetical protein